MSAVFDTVNHTILLQRLETSFGITGSALQWFSLFLKDRTVSVTIGNASSDPIILDCSLPQGSKIGPRSYSDYTQLLGRLLHILNVLYNCYEDDSQLFKSMCLKLIPSQNESAQHLSECIKKVEKWTHDNKLKLNPIITEFMILCYPKNRHELSLAESMLQDGPIN